MTLSSFYREKKGVKIAIGIVILVVLFVGVYLAMQENVSDTVLDETMSLPSTATSTLELQGDSTPTTDTSSVTPQPSRPNGTGTGVSSAQPVTSQGTPTIAPSPQPQGGTGVSTARPVTSQQNPTIAPSPQPSTSASGSGTMTLNPQPNRGAMQPTVQQSGPGNTLVLVPEYEVIHFVYSNTLYCSTNPCEFSVTSYGKYYVDRVLKTTLSQPNRTALIRAVDQANYTSMLQRPAPTVGPLSPSYGCSQQSGSIQFTFRLTNGQTETVNGCQHEITNTEEPFKSIEQIRSLFP